ncbi:hypothetical protein BH23THE1_BH23THE1_27560 [soil metagenome]
MDALILKKEEKERLVIKLAMEGLTTRNIAKVAHVSLKDIGSIIRRYNGEDIEYQNKALSVTSKAFQVFKGGKSLVDVANALNLESFDVQSLFRDYLELSNLDSLVTTYDYLGNNLPIFLDLFDKMKDEGILTQPAIAIFVQSGVKLARLEEESLKLCGQIGRLNDKKAEIKEEIERATSLLRYLRDKCSKLQ